MSAARRGGMGAARASYCTLRLCPIADSQTLLSRDYWIRRHVIQYCHGRHPPQSKLNPARSPVLPDLPTVAEFAPGYEFSFWTGIGAPRNTPAEIVDKLNAEINAALADPKMKARLAEWGATALPGSPADFGKLIADETEKWGKVIRAANIKAE